MATETIAETSTKAGMDLVGTFLPFLIATLLLFGILFLVYWLLKKSNLTRNKGDFFHVLASQPLDRLSSIHLVRFTKEFFVVGTANGHISVIHRFTDPEDKEMLNLQFQKRKISPFMATLNRKVFDEQVKKLDAMDE